MIGHHTSSGCHNVKGYRIDGFDTTLRRLIIWAILGGSMDAHAHRLLKYRTLDRRSISCWYLFCATMVADDIDQSLAPPAGNIEHVFVQSLAPFAPILVSEATLVRYWVLVEFYLRQDELEHRLGKGLEIIDVVA